MSAVCLHVRIIALDPVVIEIYDAAGNSYGKGSLQEIEDFFRMSALRQADHAVAAMVSQAMDEFKGKQPVKKEQRKQRSALH